MAEVEKVEELCKVLELGDQYSCVQWMKDAVEHCRQIIDDPDRQDSNLWAAMRTAFSSSGSNSNGGLSSNGATKDQIVSGVKTGIGAGSIVSPNELSYEECSKLFKTIADDYLQKWPCSSHILTAENMLYGVVFVLVLALFLISFNFFNKKYNKKYARGSGVGTETTTRPLTPSCTSTPRQSQELNLSPSTSAGQDVDDVSNVSCSKTIIVKINRERNGKTLENGYSEYNFKDVDQELPYHRETLEKVIEFVEDYSKNLRIIILIDDDMVCRELDDIVDGNEPLQKCRDQSSDLKYTRSVSALSSSSSSMLRSRIPVSNFRKSP